MFLLRRTEPRCDRRAGYTLVEVVVAILVSSIIVISVFSVAVTSKAGSGKNDRRLAAGQAAAQVTAQLKGYVTACGCNPSTGDCSACASSPVLGPNTNNSGVSTWYLSGGGVADAGSLGGAARNVYALACGDHFVTGIVPPLEASPFNGYIRYTVTYPGGCPTSIGVTAAPQVTLSVNWTEP